MYISYLSRRVQKALVVSSAIVILLATAVGISSAIADTADSYFSHGGTVNILSSSHQDIAWMDDPHSCMLYRVNHCITPALELMQKDRSYTFVMENMLNLMEFLEVFPERKEEIQKLTQEGRLEWGATYNQPYESLLSGEELIRETYFGRRWLKKTFPDCDARVAFNPDVPGRALQMQQILSKAGIPYLIISRYHEGIYRWLSPDGSGVIAYTPGHYGNPTAMLTAKPPDAIRAIAAKLAEQGAYYQKRAIPPALCLLNSQDFSRPTDFSPLINLWNSQTFMGGGHATAQDRLKPAKMQYASAKGFFDQIAAGSSKIDTLVGERPDIWLYIHGPTHHWAISAKREAARVLPVAETFSAVSSLLQGNFRNYPSRRLTEAWMAGLYPDHGWGGKNGHITDELFKHKAEFARNEGQQILDQSLHDISLRVKTSPAKGTPVLVFNALSWKRSDPVVLNSESLPGGSDRLLDTSGSEVPFQWTTLHEPEEINVAAARVGAKALASSSAGVNFGPEKAIDGKWSSLETDRWVSSADGKGPHWLTIDFGKTRKIHKVVIRHEGSLGAYQDEEQFNTTDFQLQWADSPNGPWKDLVSAISDNSAVLTKHTFEPKAFRYLRLYIKRAAARTNDPARIFEVQAFSMNSAKSPRLLFIAKDVPPIGYKTYYLAKDKQGTSKSKGTAAEVAAPSVYENSFYRIELSPGGIKSILDKQFQQELIQSEKFLGGEVFTMSSVGNGAGEFPAVQQPTMKGFDKVSNHKPEWRLMEAGPIRTVFALEQTQPAYTIQQKVLVYESLKRLDCEVSILDWNGQKYREFRMALPLNMPGGQVAYEVPMGVVEVGKSEIPTTGGLAYGSLNYHELCSKIRPREVQNFMSASSKIVGLTMSSSVAVFDYQDPTTDSAGYPVLQPVLLASRKSCHGEGNWYLQPGNHHFHFSVTSHSPGWQNGYRFGIQANHPLITKVGMLPAAGASLPEEQSFFTISPENVLISTIKKGEDDNTVVIRFYDIEGRDSQVGVN